MYSDINESISSWDLKNITNDKWTITKPDKSLVEFQPGKTAALVIGNKINFGKTEGIISQ